MDNSHIEFVIIFLYMNKIIYLAGGCFWGVSEYYSRLKGITLVTSGYANGYDNKINPTYEEVKSGIYNFVETIKIIYDDNLISLNKILEHYLRFVDPYSLNKQGEDFGVQYRTGIYYTSKNDEHIIKEYLDSHLNKNYAIEILPLNNFYLAEDYHQDYLKKNPHGYCHINLNLILDDEKK